MNPPKQRLLNEEIRLLMGKDDRNFWQEAKLYTSGDFHRKQGNSSLSLCKKENDSIVYPPRKSSLLAIKGFNNSIQHEPCHLIVEDSTALKPSSKFFTDTEDSLFGFTSIGRKVFKSKNHTPRVRI